MLCEMENLNRPLEEPFRQFLQTIIGHAREHARFLNMLSLLEHIGSRKIMLSQMRGPLTQEVLKHLAEETRHAFFFKREAAKVRGASVDSYTDENTLCAAAGRAYFGRLDAFLTAELSALADHKAGYWWMSLIVELRALWVYRLYQQMLNDAQCPLSLTALLSEEDRHLSDMAAQLEDAGFVTGLRVRRAIEHEKRLFQRLFSQLQQGSLGIAPRAEGASGRTRAGAV
jgi:hypothetical protein